VLGPAHKHVFYQHDEIPDPTRHSVESRHADAVSLVVPKATQDFLESFSIEALAGLSVVSNDVDQLRVGQLQVPLNALSLSL
jgi:hypothetical protein